MDNHSQQPQYSRIQRIVAGVLTALFLATVFGIGAWGIWENPDGILTSLRFHKAKKYLADPEDTSFFAMTQARIASLQNRLTNNLPLKDEMSVVNASFQYALGKRMVVEGSEQMIRLPNNQLYYITTRQSLADEAQDVVDLYNYIDGETPFLFSFVHPGFFNGGLQLPDGYSTMDTSDELADEALSIVRAAGIEALDSRTFFENTRLTNEELMLKTDKHWTTLAALLAAQIYAGEINRITGANLDVSRLDLDQFDTEVHEDLFFGDFGQLIGLHNSQLEDITVYTPRYETSLTRHSEHRTGDVEDETGDFYQAIVRDHALERSESGYNGVAYTDYGLIEAFETIENHAECEDMTVLVLRDSYSEPICGFLSLLVKNVISADLRYCEKSAVELINEYQPDMVIVSYSRLMFEDHTYNFGVPN